MKLIFVFKRKILNNDFLYKVNIAFSPLREDELQEVNINYWSQQFNWNPYIIVQNRQI